MEVESSRANSVLMDFVSALLLTSFCAFLFRGVLLDGNLLFGSDFVGFYQGLKQFLLDEVHTRHAIPCWNPYVFGGMPFWAHLESTIFYPLDFLFWFMAPEKAFGYTMFLHLNLAALFMYTLLRSLSTGHGGSFVGAMVFACNGFIMATLYDGQMFRVQAYIWLPLIICLLNRALKPDHSYLNAVFAGLFWGYQILSGSPQDGLYTLMAAVPFCLMMVPGPILNKKGISKAAAVLCLFFLAGVGTAAIQVVPAIEFIGLSVRSAFDAYELVTMGSYPPEGIVTAIIPDFFGSYIKGEWFVNNVPWSIPLYNLYVGILPLTLLFFISFRNRFDRRVVFFAAILALGAFLLSLGANTPIYRFLYLLPGFDRIRAPAKIIYLYVFALGLLSAKGMDGLLKMSLESISKRAVFLAAPVLLMLLLDVVFHWNRSVAHAFFSLFMLDEMIPEKANLAVNGMVHGFHVATLLCTSILLLILLGAKGVLRRGLLMVLLSALFILDVTGTHWGSIRYGNEGYAWARKTKKNLGESLGKDDSIYRVGSLPNAMGPNFEMYLGFQTIAGYNPLYLHPYYQYIKAYNADLLKPGNVAFFFNPKGNSVLMDLLNVKYVIDHKKGTFRLRESCLPRAFFVPDGEIPNPLNILERMTQPGFDPTAKVLLEETARSAFVPEQKTDKDAPSNGKGTVEITYHSPDEIRAKVVAPRPGYLFFSEIHYPGWHAFVDNNPEELLRGNYLFRVVQVPQGQHAVKLVFRPWTIRVGIWITLTTLLLIAVFCGVHFIRRKGT